MTTTTNKRTALFRSLLAGSAALAIAGSTLAYAQQGPGGGGGRDRDRGQSYRPNMEDMAAFSDARIAAVHAGLKLTPEQEKNWPAAEAAYRDYVKQRADRMAARASADRPAKADPLERLGARADAMAQQAAALKKLVDAASPLYKSLDDGQKRRLRVLARLGGRDGMRGDRGHGRHHGGPRHERGGQDGQDGPKGRSL